MWILCSKTKDKKKHNERVPTQHNRVVSIFCISFLWSLHYCNGSKSMKNLVYSNNFMLDMLENINSINWHDNHVKII